MRMQYLLYFDAGTSNTRAYLLNAAFDICYTAHVNVGSKDAAIVGNNNIILETMCSLYRKVLSYNGLEDGDISEIYASGMVTSPYGLTEVPHVKIPVSVADFSGRLYRYHESTNIKRDILLVPGMKTEDTDFSFIGNMRGEEIEVIGALDELKAMGIQNAALVLPGSHTHIAYVKGDAVEDILSTFTGELFYALKQETILSPILDCNMNCNGSSLDPEMIRLAMSNLQLFGFNRALYIAHCMRIMDKYTPEQRRSYCEGIINGGIRQALEYYLSARWTDCEAIVFVCTEYMYKLFCSLFAGSTYEDRIVWLKLTPESCYSIKGLKKIVEEKSRHKNENNDYIPLVRQDKRYTPKHT